MAIIYKLYMKNRTRNYRMIGLSLGIWLLWPKNAYAYLDPGSGSYLIQILIGFGLGSLFFLKQIIVRIKLFFTREKEKK